MSEPKLTIAEQITLALASLRVGGTAMSDAFQRRSASWHSDPIVQALNRYRLDKDAEAEYRSLANKHEGTTLATLLTEKADEYRQRAHDAVLEAAEAVKQERGL